MSLKKVALAVALLSACDEPAAPAAALRPVRVVTVEPLDIGQALSQTGEIRPRYETDLAFRIGGQILARPVDVGSVIGRGDADGDSSWLDTRSGTSNGMRWRKAPGQ